MLVANHKSCEKFRSFVKTFNFLLLIWRLPAQLTSMKNRHTSNANIFIISQTSKKKKNTKNITKTKEKRSRQIGVTNNHYIVSLFIYGVSRELLNFSLFLYFFSTPFFCVPPFSLSYEMGIQWKWWWCFLFHLHKISHTYLSTLRKLYGLLQHTHSMISYLIIMLRQR